MVSSHETPANLPPESTDGSTQENHYSTESTTIPSSLPQKFVAKVFSPQPLQIDSKQAKTLEKTLTLISDQIKTFQLFDQVLNSLEVMEKLNVDFNIIYS